MLGAFTQGMTGFGFALVSIPLLSMIVDIKFAISLGVLCGAVINFSLIIKMHQHVKFKEVLYLILGSVVGTPIGAYVLASTGESYLKNLLGWVVLIFVIFTVFRFIKPVGLNRKWGYLFGFFAGVLGGAFNTNGPPILIYMYLQGWDKTEQKAAITGFFVVATIMIIVSHISMGLVTSDVLIQFLYVIPVLLIGIYFGHLLFQRVSTKLYNNIVLAGLTLIGILLIFNI